MKYNKRKEESKSHEQSESPNFETGEKLMKTEPEYQQPTNKFKGKPAIRMHYKGKSMK